MSHNIAVSQENRQYQKRDKTSYEVTIIIEKNSHQALEFATIIFRSLRGKRIFGGLSDKNGKIKIDIPKGVLGIKEFFLINLHFMYC